MLFVTCATNLEPLLVEELRELGIEARQGFRGVFIPKTIENVYLVNYRSRLAIRVLWPLHTFSCRDRFQLYEEAKKIDWQLYMHSSKTFAIDADVEHPNLRNSLFAALVVKDAVCDYLREKSGVRPSVDVRHPDVQLHLFIQNNRATISLDTSGAPLFKRGWRRASVEAPLQESTAAAILRWSGYNAKEVLVDQFCGSGTLLIEAAMIATNTPPGMHRKIWGFVNLPEHSQALWTEVRRRAHASIIPLEPGKIFGFDRDPKAVQITRNHAEALGFPISVSVQEVRRLQMPAEATLVVTNPPYGKRLAEETAYADLGGFLRKFKTRAALLAPEKRLLSSLPIGRSIALMNGGLKVSLFACG